MKWIKRLIKLLLLLLLLAAAFVTWQGYRMYSDALEERPLEEEVADIEGMPGYMHISQLPDMYIDAVIAVEDHRFMEHHGVDIVSIGRAIKTNIMAGELREGGSTITQQLAKNIYFSQSKDIVRKVAETFMALKMERDLSKDEILELYVNTIYFGDGYYGIRAASEGYYGVEPLQLEDCQCTMLAGMPNAPSVYAPTVNPDLAAERQRYVIDRMVEYGYITQDEGGELTDCSYGT